MFENSDEYDSEIGQVLKLAVQLHESGDFQAAEQMYQRVLQQQPQNADALQLLGLIALQQNQPISAIRLISRAIDARPDVPFFHRHLGDAYAAVHNFKNASDSYRRALQIDPDSAETHFSLAKLLAEQTHFDEAETHYRAAIELRPDFAEANNNLGVVLKHLGQFDASVACYERALAINADDAATHLHLASIRLAQGEFEIGWREYEWRWKTHDFNPRGFAQPLWNGSDLFGMTILVHAEQGLGDTLHFARYLKFVKERGGTVVFECQKPLVRLFNDVAGIDWLVPQGDALRPFDVHVPLLSLPRIFNTTLSTVPADVPYITADPTLIAQWDKQLEQHAGFRVGICWQGSPEWARDRFRSFPLSFLLPLAAIPGVTLVSLQKGHGVDQLDTANETDRIVNLGAHLDEQSGPFMDTAAVMMNLDLVITCDSAIVHLAGALGVSVWLAAESSADWRWLRDRDDNPWYPTLRIFRQQTFGDWSNVFHNMKRALRDMVDQKPADQHRSNEATLLIPVSVGELLDKISILEIKRQRIQDRSKLANVERELNLLEEIRTKEVAESLPLSRLTDKLRNANEQLWEIEDQIRLREAAKDFGEEFIELARSVYRTNDKRASLKRQINELLGSTVVEEKSYADYE